MRNPCRTLNFRWVVALAARVTQLGRDSRRRLRRPCQGRPCQLLRVLFLAERARRGLHVRIPDRAVNYQRQVRMHERARSRVHHDF